MSGPISPVALSFLVVSFAKPEAGGCVMRKLSAVGLRRTLLLLPVLLLAPSPTSAGNLPYVGDAITRIQQRWGINYPGTSLGWGVWNVPRGNEYSASFTATTFGLIRAIGACDRDCSMMRVRIIDYTGRELTRRDGVGGVADVQIIGQPGQTYRIFVQPLNCSTPNCMVAWEAVV